MVLCVCGIVLLPPFAISDVEEDDDEDDDIGVGGSGTTAASSAAAGGNNEEDDDEDDDDDYDDEGRYFVVPRLDHKPRYEVDKSTETPCGMCRIKDKCAPGGLVSPQACVYLQAWMDF